jgi:membrane protease YdiL (CAAX protease family)
LALLLYANLADLIVVVGGADRILYDLASLVLLIVLVGCFILFRRHELGSLGVQRRGLVRSAAWGALLGLSLAAVPLLFFAFPFLLAGPVHYPAITGMSAGRLVWELLVRVPIVTVLLQEFLFRGLLQRQFTQAQGLWRGVITTNLFFSAWHLVIAWDAVSQQAVALPFLPPAAYHLLGYVGALIVVLVGGTILSLLRWRTDNLAGPIMAHWLVVALMTIMLYAR